MDPTRILAGLLLLFLGRKLFWLFVGITGFLAGMVFAGQFLAREPLQIQLVISLVAGLIGVLFAIFLQRVAIAIGGFLAGAYLFFLISGRFAVQFRWIALIVGGILGAILLSFFFDWALIALSSMLGASLLSESAAHYFHVQLWMEHLLFLALVIIGFLVQGALKRPSAPRAT